jgi:hypothetical protein
MNVWNIRFGGVRKKIETYSGTGGTGGGGGGLGFLRRRAMLV